MQKGRTTSLGLLATLFLVYPRIGGLDCKGTLIAHSQPVAHQATQVLLCGAHLQQIQQPLTHMDVCI